MSRLTKRKLKSLVKEVINEARSKYITFNCSSKKDFDKFKNYIINQEEYYAEVDKVNLAYEFQDADIDALELEIQQYLDEYDINGYWEET